MDVYPQDEMRPERLLTFDDGSTMQVTTFGAKGEEAVEGEAPTAILVDYTSGPGGTTVAAHFHHIRQFQVVTAGEGSRIGKSDMTPISFHYTDPDSPYGPIVPGESNTISYFTLRPRASKGIYYMPGSKEFMLKTAGRNIAKQVTRNDLLERGTDQEALIERHDDGLAAYTWLLGPGESIPGPEPEGAGGQYYLVCGGELVHDGRPLGPFSLAWVAPDEPPPLLVAGERGANVLVLQFPVATEVETEGLASEAGRPRAEHGDRFPRVVERLAL